MGYGESGARKKKLKVRTAPDCGCAAAAAATLAYSWGGGAVIGGGSGSGLATDAGPGDGGNNMGPGIGTAAPPVVENDTETDICAVGSSPGGDCESGIGGAAADSDDDNSACGGGSGCGGGGGGGCSVRLHGRPTCWSRAAIMATRAARACRQGCAPRPRLAAAASETGVARSSVFARGSRPDGSSAARELVAGAAG